MLWIMGRFGAVPEMEWRSQRYARAGWCFSASKAPDRRKKSEFRPIFDQIWLLNQTLDATFVFRDATFVFRRKHDLTFAKVSSTFVSKVCLTFGKTFAKVCLMVTSTLSARGGAAASRPPSLARPNTSKQPVHPVNPTTELTTFVYVGVKHKKRPRD